MLQTISIAVLKLFGWQAKVTLPAEKKYVLIVYPHTSNWDFPIGLLASWTIKPTLHWVAKIQLFRGPFKYLLSALGGIPVDRSAANGFIEQIVEKFNNCDEMVLTIAPEGTRSKTPHLKTGFYYIALQAEVPIYLGYIDYATKQVGYAEKIIPSGDIDADLEKLKAFYQDKVGKYPDKHSTMSISQRNKN